MKCCEIPIGKMRRKGILQHREKTSDGAGGYTNDWTPYADVFMWIEPVSGNELLQSMKLNNPITHKIYMRYRGDVVESDRIFYRDKYFNIISLLDVEERRRFYVIKAIENVPPEDVS